MRRLALILALLIAGVYLEAAAAPRLDVDLPAYAFPDTVEGMAVVHTFLLTNTGDEELLITDVKVSCGCTTTALTSDRLAPGETVDLTVMVDTNGFRNWIEKTVFVSSNDPARQPPNELSLSLSGNVLERPPYQYPVERLVEAAYTLIDVREPEAYLAGHLAGAMSIPAGEIPARASSLPAGVLTIVYDQDGNAATLEAVTQALHEGGVAFVYALQGGFDAWKANYPDTRIVYGESVAETFLDTSGSREYSLSNAVRDYAVGRLLTDYVLIDVRPVAQFAAGHLAGAVNMDEPALVEFVGRQPSEVLVIIYSDDGADSDRIVKGLWDTLDARPRSLLGGLAEWQREHGQLLIAASAG